MRRITLALALAGAVAAVGCGKSGNDEGTAGNPGIKDGTYSVKIQNGQDETNLLAKATLQIKNGWVTSVPAGIDCGITGHALCSASFPTGSTVTLTAVPATTTPATVFLTWGGDCQGNGACVLDGAADKYLVAIFGQPGSVPHGNLTDPTIHAGEYAKYMAGTAGALDCKTCHGATLQGQGIAVACTACHYAAAANVNATQERCKSCHAGSGSYHQTIDNSIWDAPKLAATVDTVTYDAGTKQVTVNFSLTKNGAPYAATISGFAQKTVYVSRFDPTTQQFVEYASLGVLAAGSTPGTYTAKNDIVGKPAATPPVAPTLVNFDPTTSTAFAYVYFAENPTVIPAKGNYKLYDSVASAAMKFGTWSYATTAPSDNCKKCHPDPYMKHGYRAAKVTNLEDLVACKACHADNRVGHDAGWQLLATDPAQSAAGVDANTLPQFAYVASIKNDTHMSHSMEFAYPQSMANCITCHENPATPGKFTSGFAQKEIKLETCKSCHPVTATAASTGAPPLYPSVGTAPAAGFKQGIMPGYHALDADGNVGGHACSYCHADNASGIDPATHIVSYYPAGDPRATDGVGPTMFGSYVPLLMDLHNKGLDERVYTAAGEKIASILKTQLVSSSYVAATNVLTAQFSMSAIVAANTVKPTVVVSLYGYDTKDFVVSGHGSMPSPDGTSLLEWTEGACQRGTGGAGQPACKPANSARLTVEPSAPGKSTWTVTANLSNWASLITAGTVKRIEIAFLPSLNDAKGVALAIGGLSKTIAVPSGAVVEDMYGKDIVDTAKCNRCHEALAIEFHSPNYGSAGVVGCRLCHVVGTGGSHLEMQSRSIDSYVHALHSMQYMDVQNVDWTDPVAAMRYNHHIESTYPKFTTLDCESCHNPGKYDVPDQSRSLPGIQSASSTLKAGFPTATRAQFNVASVVTGPGSRACGGCHRAQFINEHNAAGLARYDSHTGGEFGYRQTSVAATTTSPSTLDQIIAKLKGLFL